MNDTPTPRTDEATRVNATAWSEAFMLKTVLADFARQLERELSACQAELAAEREKVEEATKNAKYWLEQAADENVKRGECEHELDNARGNLAGAFEKLERELATLKERNATLETELQRWRAWATKYNDGHTLRFFSRGNSNAMDAIQHVTDAMDELNQLMNPEMQVQLPAAPPGMRHARTEMIDGRPVHCYIES